MKEKTIDLVLEGSREVTLLLLVEGQALLAKKEATTRDPGVSLVSSIESFLEENGLGVTDLASIFVGIGPGSYTGVRVAVAAGEGLSFALSIPLLPFYSPLAYLAREAAFVISRGKHKHFVLQTKDLTHRILSEEELACFIAKEPEALLLDPTCSTNSGLLIPYLVKIKKQPQGPIKIVYLHDF